MKIKEKYSKENFEKAVKESASIKEVLSILGLRTAGGNYKIFHKYIDKYEIDISHFDSRKNIYDKGLRNYIYGNKIALDDILVENSNYNRGSLKKRLYDEGLKERFCEMPGCGQGEEWMGKKMSLILDHINGVYNDNRIENLRIVCANCNATLPTHAGKNSKKDRVKYECNDCGVKITKTAKRCYSCSNKEKMSNGVNLSRRVVQRPPYSQLQQEISELGYSGTGRKYGVSDNAVRKWIKNYEK